jgi:hypothetical protein
MRNVCGRREKHTRTVSRPGTRSPRRLDRRAIVSIACAVGSARGGIQPEVFEMLMNRSVTAAELDEARRLIVRSQQQTRPVSRGGKVASGVAPAVGAAMMAWQRRDAASAAADDGWRQTEWCETTVEARD